MTPERLPVMMQQLEQLVEAQHEAKKERAEILALLQGYEVRQAVLETEHSNCQAGMLHEFDNVWKAMDARVEAEKDLRDSVKAVDNARKWEGRIETMVVAVIAGIGLLKS